MKEVIGGKRYDTETATCIADDRYWDGNNFERSGRNTFLYKTKKGSFFTYHTTMWQGETSSISPVSREDALDMYERLRQKHVEYEEAFGVAPEEA